MKKTDNKKKPNPFTYSIVPNFIKPDDRLSPLSKLIYSDIYSLTKYRGFCSASNVYFEKLYCVKKSTITKCISELRRLEYIICVYENKNHRKIYLSEKNSVETDDDIILPSDENLIPNFSHHDDENSVSASSNSTIMIPKKPQHKIKKSKSENTIVKYNKSENRSTDVLRHSFSDKDKLESILLEALSSLYNKYKYYDFDSIVTSIEDALERENCKEDIFQIGLKKWFHSVLNEDELEVADENLTEEEFLSLNESVLDNVFKVLNS